MFFKIMQGHYRGGILIFLENKRIIILDCINQTIPKFKAHQFKFKKALIGLTAK